MKTMAWASYRGRPVPERDYLETWIAWLESGAYKQGRMMLRTLDNEFCCLGVAADIVGCTWRPRHDSFCASFERDDSIGFKGFLPTNVKKMFSLNVLEKNGYERDAVLMKMNDSGLTFKAIAAHIRSYKS